MITLDTELVRIRGLTPQFLAKLHRLGLRTVRELLWHFPTRYEDFSRIVPIAELELNQSATIRGVVRTVELRRTWRRHMALVEAHIADETGAVKAIWFNQPYVARALRPGLRVNFAGKLVRGDEEVYLSNPAYEVACASGAATHTAGLIPLYPETKGLTSRGLRYLIAPILRVLPPIPECLPADVRGRAQIPEINAAIRAIHFPRSLREAEAAKERFAFEDLFLLQLTNLMLRSRLARERAPAIAFSSEALREALAALPFTLTSSQERSLAEILGDMAKAHPMNRLLQGDVGSGKTVVAAIAAIAAAHAGFQAAFMAPTEVLARQHHETVRRIFSALFERNGISAALLVSGISPGERKERLHKIAQGAVQIVFGTHALIEEDVRFRNLAFVVVDEQHRFGVSQRAQLVGRGSTQIPPAGGTQMGAETKRNPRVSVPLPHFLSMSATPIPRTLSLTLFGDLDLSIIDELPKGRKPIVTKVVAPENRQKAYGFVRGEIAKGRQAFVICPRIEKAEVADGAETPQTLFAKQWGEVRAVKEEYEKLASRIFPDLAIAMLHGRMKSKEKEAVMRGFKEGETQLLVATSVVEVGVDVPNAAIMIIEGADRFGLSQLYQFRGRIGRGEHQSFCLLFTDSQSASVHERLRALLKAKNGFELAEEDLRLRGPGQFLGEKQTGIPDIAMASLNDFGLVKRARDSAAALVGADAELARAPILKARLAAFQEKLHLE